MARTYYITFRAAASDVVEVEADSLEEAMERAWDEFDEPYFGGGDLSDWEIDEAWTRHSNKEGAN